MNFEKLGMEVLKKLYDEMKMRSDCMRIVDTDKGPVYLLGHLDDPWIPVEQHLPPEKTYVLVHRFGGVIEKGWWMWQEYWLEDGPCVQWMELDGRDAITGCTVTHWMPLPDPPKEKK